jgi:thymidine kinase
VELFFRYAAMNAGKSTALLQVAHNYGSAAIACGCSRRPVDRPF